ncbi:S8 family peptidase [Natronoarchaeum rubrum]|uniref:S8 family peptidase n=1 Tax=Natronoarchaeum rubrum TaxID=755311 RepID=UPI002111AA30|nr:S8 family serine peptidase [Natronoarchaeum rubrum]
MTHTRRTVLRSIGSAGLIASAVGAASATGEGDARYVVTAGGGDAGGRVERAGFDVRHELAGGSVLIVEGPSGDRDALASVNGVRNAARDLRIAFDGPALEDADETRDEPLYDLQWDKQRTSAAPAHDVATGEGATLAILDTGVDHDHPDLTPNLDADRSRLFRAGEIREGTGAVEVPVDRDDPTKGTMTDSRNVADDVDGHGSHVGGIAAAPRNGAGIVGTAPDASLVALRVFYYDEIENEDGETVSALTTTTADILLAIDYAARIGADAANMSLGTETLPPKSRSEGMHVAYDRVIKSATRRGTLVVASAGNAESDLQRGGQYSLPNSTPGALSVSATGPNDELSFYSNYGTNEIDVGAPGGGYETLEKSLSMDTEWPYPTNLVLSTVPPELYDGATHSYFAGTSMAAPQVTGLAGLVRELDPSITAKRVEQAIKHGADGANGRSSPELGAGLIDVANTVERVSGGNDG